MTGLCISTELTLPLDTVTSTLVVYGGKGMGKTNLLSVVLEEMSKAALRWCAIDPVGVLWGLRHAANGRDPGVRCLILGGVHGDLPIYPDSGEVVADLVADNDVNVIIDCSRDAQGQMWSVGERTRFLTAFARRIFQRQGSLIDGRRREPLFIALDEAARYIPEQIPAGNPDLAKSVGAWEQLVEEGRNVGIGVGLFTQRSARLKKSVAELADAMLAFRTVGPRSIDAVMDWLGEHVPKTHIRELIEQVRQIAVGTALAVSPGWLRFEGVIRIRPRETFDSSATPKPGASARRVSGRGATVDLEQYRVRMAETVQRAKAEDPKELHKRIAELERQLREQPTQQPAERIEVPVEVRVEVAPIEVVALLQQALPLLGQAQHNLADALTVVDGMAKRDRQDLPRTRPAGDGARPVERPRPAQRPHPPQRREPDRPAVPRATPSGIDLTDAHQRVLDAIAWLHAVGFARPTKLQTGFIAGYRVTKKLGGKYSTVIGDLRAAGLVDYPAPATIVLTDAGRSSATPVEIEMTTAGLQAAIFARLDEAERRVLQVIIDAHPDAIGKQEVGGAAGYTVTAKLGGKFSTILGHLRALGLIDYPSPGLVAAEPVLFLNSSKG